MGNYRSHGGWGLKARRRSKENNNKLTGVWNAENRKIEIKS